METSEELCPENTLIWNWRKQTSVVEGTHLWYSVTATPETKCNQLWEASSGTPHPTVTFFLQPSIHVVLQPLFEFSLQRKPTKFQPHTFHLGTILSVRRYSLLCAAIHVIVTIEVYNDNIGTL